MSPAPTPSGWGPQHQRPRRTPYWTLIAFFVLMTFPLKYMLALLAGAFVVKLAWSGYRRRRTRGPRAVTATGSADPLEEALDRVAAGGGGVLLGLGENGDWRLARADRAVLLLGPPRSGKSSGVIIPTVLSRPGPVVSTSTKPDVLRATIGARSRLGRGWEFDPTGEADTGDRALRWSPVTCARSWDGALMIARAMVTGAGVGLGTTDGGHWSKRAQALLAPSLHAAALASLDMDRVLGWVMGHELDEPGAILQDRGAELAAITLSGLARTEERERSSIFSAAADALEAYTASGALAAASSPNFDADAFVCSQDTVYVHAAAERQALAAPLVCGLLAEIRRASYAAHAAGRLRAGVLFALDEAANIAPLAELPQIASEGGGQGLALIAAFQDLSQARHRWGTLADGFLTLFGEKLILPGVADPKTLEAVSVALGEYDRQVVSHTRNPGGGLLAGDRHGSGTSRTTSTQRQRVLSPGDVANIPAGKALHLDGLRWELLEPTPAHRTEPWRTLAQLPARPQEPAETGVAEEARR